MGATSLANVTAPMAGSDVLPDASAAVEGPASVSKAPNPRALRATTRRTGNLASVMRAPSVCPPTHNRFLTVYPPEETVSKGPLLFCRCWLVTKIRGQRIATAQRYYRARVCSAESVASPG